MKLAFASVVFWIGSLLAGMFCQGYGVLEKPAWFWTLGFFGGALSVFCMTFAILRGRA